MKLPLKNTEPMRMKYSKGWKKGRYVWGKDIWFNKERDIRLEIEKGKVSMEEYPYGILIHSLSIVAGGSKYLKGFNTKLEALKFAHEYMRKH